MKISILLPYKENFSPDYPGAVSLFVYETTKISKYRSSIKVYGNTEFKNKFKLFSWISIKTIFLWISITTSFLWISIKDIF